MNYQPSTPFSFGEGLGMRHKNPIFEYVTIQVRQNSI